MHILIAEAKTMRATQQPVTPQQLAAHMPARYQQAASIAATVAAMPVPELAATAGVSPTIAQRMFALAHDFPIADTGYAAIDGYTGVVFKALDPATFTPDMRQAAQQQIIIASSLYGLLRPEDIIKPYRLEYKMALPQPIGPLTKLWRRLNTIDLVNRLKESGNREVVNLMPKAASDCFDWKLIKSFARVYHIEIKEVRAAGLMMTPSAGVLKETRGRILRQILRQHATEAYQITTLESDDFQYMGELTYADTFTFAIANL